MAKIKVFYTEGFQTWIVKEPVEIDTNDYPELEGLSKEEVEKYLNDNASDMKSTDGDEANEWSLLDECSNMDDRRVKEYGHDSEFEVEIED